VSASQQQQCGNCSGIGDTLSDRNDRQYVKEWLDGSKMDLHTQLSKPFRGSPGEQHSTVWFFA
jgi:hypothetical protein